MRLFVLVIMALLAFSLAGCKPGEPLLGAPTIGSAAQDPLKVELEELGFVGQSSAGSTELWTLDTGESAIEVTITQVTGSWIVIRITRATIECELSSRSAERAFQQFDIAETLINSGRALPLPREDRVQAGELVCTYS